MIKTFDSKIKIEDLFNYFIFHEKIENLKNLKLELRLRNKLGLEPINVEYFSLEKIINFFKRYKFFVASFHKKF